MKGELLVEIASIKSRFFALRERLKEFWQDIIEEKETYEVIESQETSLEDYLSMAQKEWKEALDHFDNVTEPELVDHASFMLRAAESKYVYLLKKYKEEVQKN